MKIEFLAKFSKDLDKIPERHIKAKVIDFIELLDNNDKLTQIPNIKKTIWI